MMADSAPRRFDERRRSSARIPMSIAITLQGTDSAGNSFTEQTNTVVVNRGGAKILTQQSFAAGDQLEVVIPRLNRKSSARVVWLGAKEGEWQEAGLDIDQIGDFWGVQFPEDAAPFHTPSPEMPPAIAPAAPVAEARSRIPETPAEASGKLLGGVRELARGAVEEIVAEILQELNRQAKENLDRLQQDALQQAQTRLLGTVEAGIEELQTRVMEAMASQQEVWERTLQGLEQQTEERILARSAAYEAHLATHAEQVRRELARTLAELSAALTHDQWAAELDTRPPIEKIEIQTKLS
ncbi:MAG: PilZ domain-containing protein [Acidobacteria bacterium]|nr:PilZ domain-containing protein [Acidobacteriota bacterium]